MVGNAPLSNTVVAQILAFRDANLKQVDIAARLSISQSAVSRCLRRYEATGSFDHLKSPGRPRLTSAQTDRLIRRESLADPRASSSSIAAQLPPHDTVSARTVRRRLLVDCNLKCHTAAKKPRLLPKNIKDRLAFAKRYRHWTSEQWASVLWSDETSVHQFATDYVRVRRPPGERYNPRYVCATVKKSASIMVWGCMAARGRGGLWFMPRNTTINAQVYREILEEKLQHWMRARQCEYFQHDGAPCHQAKLVKSWLADNRIQVLGPWPGQSPDINPIENCWRKLKVEVKRLQPGCYHITLTYCRQLAESMPRRLAAVLYAKGGHTKY